MPSVGTWIWQSVVLVSVVVMPLMCLLGWFRARRPALLARVATLAGEALIALASGPIVDRLVQARAAVWTLRNGQFVSVDLGIVMWLPALLGFMAATVAIIVVRRPASRAAA
jgi:hypothetical protein